LFSLQTTALCFLVKHPSGDGNAVYRIKLLRRFLCSSRIVVLWFEAWCSSSRCLLDSSSSSGDVLRVIETFLSGLTRCERSGQKSKDHRHDPYHTLFPSPSLSTCSSTWPHQLTAIHHQQEVPIKTLQHP
jgi:hypothetical protein